MKKPNKPRSTAQRCWARSRVYACKAQDGLPSSLGLAPSISRHRPDRVRSKTLALLLPGLDSRSPQPVVPLPGSGAAWCQLAKVVLTAQAPSSVDIQPQCPCPHPTPLCPIEV
jgi:hypothetical protein